eukprot:TRINITY_DN2210_c0_g1_i13.p1 TRINITY_DN2210_c0_g1~~TRINITY_DN2210_c0_g1_i13.p1  ORF type:complete len:606 (-),score=158.33 TRINITY_DN2210_c0_g1_i13:282-2099(-)
METNGLKVVKEKLSSHDIRPIESLELDSFANQSLMKKCPELLNKPVDEIDKIKKDVKVDDIVLQLESQLRESEKTIASVEQILSQRIKDLRTNASDAQCFSWCSKDIHNYDSAVYAQYTQSSLEALERSALSENPLKDIVYFRAMEEKRCTKVKPDKLEGEEETKKRKRTHSSKHRINMFIQDYATNIKQVDDALCQVCNDGDYEDTNLIVFCSTCNISVHQKCYGIGVIPEGDWICNVCQAFGHNQGRLLKCYLCSIRGGAMKQTTTRVPACDECKARAVPQPGEPNIQEGLLYDFRQEFSAEQLAHEPYPEFYWVHLSCAFWINELSLWSKDITYPISGIEDIDSRRFKLTCSVCKLRGVGCCVQCNKGKCSTAFHAECARLAGVCMEFMTSRADPSHNSIYCEKHKPFVAKKDIEKSTKRSVEEVLDFCRVTDKCVAIAEKCEEEGAKVKRRVVNNKLFNKIEKKKLLERIRFICRKSGKLLLNLTRQTDREGKDKYKVYPAPYKFGYLDTISKAFFPWNEVKVSSKFTAGNCYNKYVSIVDSEEAFMAKILQMDKDQIEKEELRVLKEKKRLEQNELRYCYCKTRANESGDIMIGIVLGKL